MSALPTADLAQMQDWARAVMAQRPPDFVIGEPARPYLRRWFVVPRNALQNVYLHEILRSDDDRALHDHPWDSRSWVLDGGYLEHTPTGAHWRAPGWTGTRLATDAHRLEIPDDRPAVSLFFTGPRVRDWGFHCPNGWRHWQEFTGGEHGELVGKGCGE